MGPVDRTDEAALWRRWRSAAAESAVAAPDALVLAAYAENRVDAAERDAVERWLAADPDALSDMLAARAARLEDTAGQVVALRRRPSPRPSWRNSIVWGSLAASLLVTSLVGFGLGASSTLPETSDTPIAQDFLDPPVGLFNGLAEEPSI